MAESKWYPGLGIQSPLGAPGRSAENGNLGFPGCHIVLTSMKIWGHDPKSQGSKQETSHISLYIISLIKFTLLCQKKSREKR